MKKAILLMTAFTILLAIPSAEAAKKAQAKPSHEEREQARMAELNNNEWTVLLTAPGGKAPTEDKLVFKEGRISLKSLEEKGFGATAFSLIAYDDSDRGTWETYQTNSDGKSNLSIRGDWSGTIMNGVISQQDAEGKSLGIWSFSSQIKTPIGGEAAAVEAKSAADAHVKNPSGVLVSKETAAP